MAARTSRSLASGMTPGLLGGDLGQPDGIGGRAAQHGGRVFDDGLQSRGAAHAASRYRETTDARGSFEPDPESEEWPEGEGEEDAVSRADAGCLVHADPVADHPIPALGRV